jgi:hypothetical protein
MNALASPNPTTVPGLPPQAGLQRRLLRVTRHWQWARTQGLGRLIEEDGLDPRARLTTAVSKRRWRRNQGVELGTAVAVFLVGVQRSGTNMIVRGLEAAPEFEVHNENDGLVFDRFLLRPLPAVRDVVNRSQHQYVLFKPLCDSHRTPELLDELGTVAPARAIWAYRSMDGRVASALAKFGDVNLRVLHGIAAGEGTGWWQAQALSDETLDFLRSFDYDTMSPATAAALFWYVRNGLFFDLGLDRRADVALVSYDSVLADPEAGMRRLCDFLGFEWRPELGAHIARRAPQNRRPLDIDPRVREQGEKLQQRLDETAGASRSPGSSSPCRSIR